MEQLHGKTYYEVLNVPPDADGTAIKAAYKERLFTNHPDKSGVIDNDNQVVMIKEAYKTLIDPIERLKYDISLKKTAEKHGFNINGAGLDVYSLGDFNVEELPDRTIWSRDCPRCQKKKGMILQEHDLEHNGTDNGYGGLNILTQCESCSLWIIVEYYEASDDDV